MERIEKCQELHGKYIDQLGDIYKKMYQQQEDFHQQYHDRVTDIKTQLENIWGMTHPPPSPFDFPSSSPPPPPPPPPPVL